jgi:hypothetical protein
MLWESTKSVGVRANFRCFMTRVTAYETHEYSDLGGRDMGIGHHSRSQGLPVRFLIRSRGYRPGVKVGDSHDHIAKRLCPGPLPSEPAKGHATLALCGNCVNARATGSVDCRRSLPRL